MATLFIRHRVQDFETWKAAFDAFDAERRTMGVTGDGAYRAFDNPNEVMAYHNFDSADAAKRFAGNSRLKEVMADAGVVGTPEFWFANRV